MAFIPSRRKKHRGSRSGEVKLQLTSMMDMFTILLVFLLKTYSTHGQLINPSQDLTLPISEIQHPPEVGLDVTVSNDWILVNGRPVERIESVETLDGFVIPKLQTSLSAYAQHGQRLEEQYGTPFSGKVTIQGDRNLPYRTLIKILATCGQSDFPNMRLVVYRKEG
ncbi:biopolymer transporter ExbD [candidate division KSB1 bacterium]|nr:biopolymer transporter ExbD [candidate division KSB1 bacterium]